MWFSITVSPTYLFIWKKSGYYKICLLVVMVMWFARVICKEFLSRKYSRRPHRDTQKLIYKQICGRNGDHEWLKMTNAFILCDLVWKVQKSHRVNREGSFKTTATHYGITISTMGVFINSSYGWIFAE